MVPRDEVTVEIWRHHAEVTACTGPDKRGACSIRASSAKAACVGADLVVRSAAEDCWYFTVSPSARGCPLAWLVSDGEASISEGFYGARARRERHARVFGR